MADATNSTPAGPFSLLGKVEGGKKAFLPPGGIVVRPPLARRLASVEVNGRGATVFDAAGVTIDACPAQVVLRGQAAAAQGGGAEDRSGREPAAHE